MLPPASRSRSATAGRRCAATCMCWLRRGPCRNGWTTRPLARHCAIVCSWCRTFAASLQKSLVCPITGAIAVMPTSSVLMRSGMCSRRQNCLCSWIPGVSRWWAVSVIVVIMTRRKLVNSRTGWLKMDGRVYTRSGTQYLHRFAGWRARPIGIS